MSDSDGRYVPDVDTVEQGFGPVSKLVTVPNPAAGVDWTAVVPGSECWELLAVRAQLVTSAAVANRAPVLVVDDQTTRILDIAPNAVQAASGTGVFSWYQTGTTAAAPAVGGVQNMSLPPLRLQSGWRCRVVTGAIDAGDQWSAIALWVISLPSFSTSLRRTARTIRRVGEAMEAEYLLESGS